MTAARTMLRQPPSEKLRFLADTVLAEAALLQITDGRLFAVPMDAARAASLRHDIDLAERVEAFAARLGRLQDTVAEKLLPGVLKTGWQNRWARQWTTWTGPNGWAGSRLGRRGSNVGSCAIS